MIYIDRYRRDENGNLIRPSAGWRKRSANAIRRAIADGRGHVVNDSIYGSDDVRAALEELFGFKCAYCESILEETGWNVEHFRPKGRVAENRQHPGYYWLAYVWENLYPSCVSCNQRRRDKPIWRDHTAGQTGGKLDQFPLESEKTRVFGPRKGTTDGSKLIDHARAERTLLIDPCWDTPSWYISYGPTGTIFAIDDHCCGNETIKVFNLKRRRLQRRRQLQVQTCVKYLKIVQELEASGRMEAEKMRSSYMELMAGLDRAHSAVAATVYSEPKRFGL